MKRKGLKQLRVYVTCLVARKSKKEIRKMKEQKGIRKMS